MPLKPETRIVERIIRALQMLRASGEPICWRKVHGSVYSRLGEPDLDIVYMGVPLKLEVKQEGRKPTAIQKHRISEWAEAGAIADVVHSSDEVVALLRFVKEGEA